MCLGEQWKEFRAPDKNMLVVNPSWGDTALGWAAGICGIWGNFRPLPAPRGEQERLPCQVAEGFGWARPHEVPRTVSGVSRTQSGRKSAQPLLSWSPRAELAVSAPSLSLPRPSCLRKSREKSTPTRVRRRNTDALPQAQPPATRPRSSRWRHRAAPAAAARPRLPSAATLCRQEKENVLRQGWVRTPPASALNDRTFQQVA